MHRSGRRWSAPSPGSSDSQGSSLQFSLAQTHFGLAGLVETEQSARQTQTTGRNPWTSKLKPDAFQHLEPAHLALQISEGLGQQGMWWKRRWQPESQATMLSSQSTFTSSSFWLRTVTWALSWVTSAETLEDRSLPTQGSANTQRAAESSQASRPRPSAPPPPPGYKEPAAPGRIHLSRALQ